MTNNLYAKCNGDFIVLLIPSSSSVVSSHLCHCHLWHSHAVRSAVQKLRPCLGRTNPIGQREHPCVHQDDAEHPGNLPNCLLHNWLG